MATLITGSTGGLGREFVKALAKRGDSLVLTGTNNEKLKALSEETKETFKDITIVYRACDLSSAEDRKSFFDWLKDSGIKIDFLVNNAGYITEGKVTSYSDEELIKVIRVNCEGTIDFTKKVLNQRDIDKPLHIITISSMAGYYPMPYMNIYSATKALLKNFMIALNYEMKGKNVFVTTICPSGIPTTKDMKEAIKAQGFNGKITMSEPSEVVKVSLKASRKHKAVVIVKPINRFIRFISHFCSDNALARITGRMWRKSQEKRNFNQEEK